MPASSQSNRPLPRPLAWFVDAVPLLIAAWLAWRVGDTMLARLPYTFDLEWMEGGMLGHAWQMANGRPLYPDPHPGHVAFVYPPGYSALVAGLGKGLGLDYAVGRVVSILATWAAAAAIAVGAWRQGGHLAPGLCGAALYLGTYNASGAFFDLVRPDALAVALMGWAVVAGLERHRHAPVLSGLLLVAAYACKHNLAIFGLPLLAWSWLIGGRSRALRFAGWSIGPALLLTFWLQWTSGGNFLRFVVGVPASHPMSGLRGFPGTQMELILWLFPGLVAAAIYLGVRAVPRVQPAALSLPLVLGAVLGAWAPGLGRANGLMYPDEIWVRHLGFAALGVIAGTLIAVAVEGIGRRQPDPRWVTGAVLAGVALLICSVMRAHHGGFINVLMPLHWCTCFGLAVIAGRARNLWPGPQGVGLTALVAAISLYWAGGRLELERLVPSVEDQAAGERVVQVLREVCGTGPIYSPYAAWLPVQAGGEPSAHLIGVWDINHPRSPFVGSVQTFREAAAQRQFSCVVEGGREPLKNGVDEHYTYARRFDLGPGELLPKTGWRARPNALHLPK